MGYPSGCIVDTAKDEFKKIHYNTHPGGAYIGNSYVQLCLNSKTGHLRDWKVLHPKASGCGPYTITAEEKCLAIQQKVLHYREYIKVGNLINFDSTKYKYL